MTEQWLDGIITVERRSDDVVAFVTGRPGLWANGRNPREAVGHLIQTHPEAVTAAIRGTLTVEAAPTGREP